MSKRRAPGGRMANDDEPEDEKPAPDTESEWEDLLEQLRVEQAVPGMYPDALDRATKLFAREYASATPRERADYLESADETLDPLAPYPRCGGCWIVYRDIYAAGSGHLHSTGATVTAGARVVRATFT